MIPQKFLSALSLALLAFVPASGDPPAGELGLHASFDGLLKKHVRDAKVDYAGLKRNEETLDRYLSSLGETNPQQLGREGKLAFWINAYNAFTIKLILKHYPGIESIKEIPRGDRWKWKGWTIHGEKHSLDQIEHEILRPMGEPRIHFAINCASYSCPDLISEAYVPDRLEEQLTAATRRFLADETKGLAVREEKRLVGGKSYSLYLSQIFHWFEGDFKKVSGSRVGSRVDFVLAYAPPGAQSFIRAHKEQLKVKKLEYDWSLNGR